MLGCAWQGKPAGATIICDTFCELYRLRRTSFLELKFNFVSTFQGFDQAAKLEAKKAKGGGKGARAARRSSSS